MYSSKFEPVGIESVTFPAVHESKAWSRIRRKALRCINALFCKQDMLPSTLSNITQRNLTQG